MQKSNKKAPKQKSSSSNLLNFTKNDIIPPPILQASKSTSLLPSHPQHSQPHKQHGQQQHRRSQSILLNNKLTKNYFSLHDTSLHNRSTFDKRDLINAVRTINVTSKIRNAGSSLLQRYHTQSRTEKTEHSIYHNITESYIPRIVLKKIIQNKDTETTPSQIKRAKSLTLQNRNQNKFKLLFRQPQPKSSSQRKIARLSHKISTLSAHNRFLQSLKPTPVPVTEPERPKPRGTIIERERIAKLAQQIIKNLSLYFSMYSHPKEVGDVLRGVEGWNQAFKDLFLVGNQARKIGEADILDRFWVFKGEAARPEYYGEQDLYLFNILQNYSLKMQKSKTSIRRHFISSQKTKIQTLKSQISKKLALAQTKHPTMPIVIPNGKAPPETQAQSEQRELADIMKFINGRRRHSQDRREDSLAKLEFLGVRFNVEQRSRELILRDKEKIVKQYGGKS